jgi:hypothetical protein
VVLLVDHKDEFVIKERLQPVGETLLYPRDVAFRADVADRVVGGGHAFHFPQYALAAIGHGPAEQLTFLVERDFVGTIGRCQHRHDHADDRHADNDADPHHHAEVSAVPGSRPAQIPTA